MLCDPTWQHSFYQIFLPLGNPCFQWFKFKYNIPFIKFFPPPLGNPCFATLPDNIPFIKFSPPPLGNPCFEMIQVQVQHSFYQIFHPPPWQPMLCDPTWQHSFYQIFPPLPLATHAFNYSSSSTTFLLSNFSPPLLATHALRPYLTTFLLSNFPPPLGNPCFAMVQVQVRHSFYQIFNPPLGNPCFATLPDNIPLIKFPPPLGNPCFQWFKFKYNIPFIKFFPSAWQPMLCDPTWQHSFYQISPPPLATHAFNDSSSSTTFLLSNVSPPPWQPMLCDPTWQHSFYQISPPCLATHAFNYSGSSTTFLLSNFFPPGQPMLCDPTWQHSFYHFFLLRPYPTTVSHQQFRTQVGSQNTPYTAKHSIQTRKRATEICSQRTARNFSTPRKTPVLLCGDPTQLLFPINSDHR